MDRALVIGASGGIGAALVGALEQRGMQIVGLSRRRNGLDLRSSKTIEQVLRQVEGTFDAILLATGILSPEGQRPEKALGAADADAIADVMQVNAVGPAMILRHVPRLLPRRGRSVLGVLSARVGSIGDNSLGGWHSYRASKAALNQIVRGAAIELGRSHPEAVVAVLHPGTVATLFTEDYAPPYEKLTPDQAAGPLLAVLDQLTPAQTGRFWNHAGREVPW